MKAMPQKIFQNWLTVQEHKKNHSIFIVEWVSIFVLAWFFWSLMFFSAPGSVPPGLAATFIAGLYASSLVYGRLLRATGCRKCTTPLPFMRQEIGRRHLRDEEECMEIQYGGPEWDQHFVHVYCRVRRADIVTFRCHHCQQVWEEKIELPGSAYKLIKRMELKN
jgi:hypothetical protein